MDWTLLRCKLHHTQPTMLTFTQGINHKLILQKELRSLFRVHKKNLKHRHYQCCSKLFPDSTFSTFVKPWNGVKNPLETDTEIGGKFDTFSDNKDEEAEEEDEHDAWEADEIEAISSLFQGRYLKNLGN